MAKEARRHPVAAMIARGLFTGSSIGIVSAFALYALCEALNILAGATVINSTAVAYLMFGNGIVASLGIEWSKHMKEAV